MEKLISFDKLKVGDVARVIKITAKNPALKRRIMDMGITKGIVIKIVKTAPLGDPLQVELRGYMLSLRKEDLKNIQGEVLEKKQIKDLER